MELELVEPSMFLPAKIQSCLLRIVLEEAERRDAGREPPASRVLVVGARNGEVGDGATRLEQLPGNSERPHPIHRWGRSLRWGIGPQDQAARDSGTCAAAVGGARRPRFTDNSTWGDTMRRVIIRSLATTAVLSGLILTGAGVAAADTARPTGGDDPSAQTTCGSGNIDFSPGGCFLGSHNFF
ncbi:MAG: hypothetical protein ACRDRO_27530 [Pseudonocardiaceae bacterium]